MMLKLLKMSMLSKLKFYRICLLLFCVLCACSKTKPKTQYMRGNVFGTTFHISYLASNPLNCEKQVDSLFQLLNRSLSTYMSSSDISKVNRNDKDVVVDDFFLEVYAKSQRIFKESNILVKNLFPEFSNDRIILFNIILLLSPYRT